MKHIVLEVDGSEGKRLDSYISSKESSISRSYIQKLISEGYVEVSGKVEKSSYKIRGGDRIDIYLPQIIIPDIKPEHIDLDIVYEDNDLILVNKPKNMVVHPAIGHSEGTLVNALLYRCKDNLSGINGILRPGIVHRIDKDTTGILVVCKNDHSHNFIANQLRKHSITRRYHAIVNDVIKNDTGIIDLNISRHPIDRKKFAVVDEHNGKRAVTKYKVLDRYKNYTYIECELETGRTHQIRVHMSHIKHPILGDYVYGRAKCNYKLEGQCLHAMTLGFIHPRTHKYMEFSAELPKYFADLLSILPR